MQKKYFIKTKNSKVTNQTGYAAISTILVLLVVISTLTMTVSLSSIDTLQSAFAQYKGTQARNIVESCVHEALLELNLLNTIPNSVVVPEGSCTLTLDSQVADTWTFSVSGTIDSYTKSIQVTAERTSTVAITSWQEL